MQVTVTLGAPLSQVVGQSKTNLHLPDGSTVADVLDALRAHHPDFDEGLKGKGLRKPFDQVPYSLFVNSRPLALDKAGERVLRDGDRIYFFLPVAGG